MHFILYNSIFDKIINYLSMINCILCIFPFKDNKESKAVSANNTLDKHLKFKNIIFTIYFIIITFLFIFFIFKYNIGSYFIFIYYISFLFMIFKLKDKNISELTQDNKIKYICATYIYIIFFSNASTSIYITYFSKLSHSIKEYMLVSFLVIKIIFFIFFLIIHISIFISSIKIIFKKPLQTIKKSIIKIIKKQFSPHFYDFNLSNKYESKFFSIIDYFIFTLLCPFSIIANIIYLGTIKIIKIIFKKILSFDKAITNYLNNSSLIIKKTIRIALIISFLFVDFIILYNPQIISNETKEFYNLIITVILIPLIYDHIKSLKES